MEGRTLAFIDEGQGSVLDTARVSAGRQGCWWVKLNWVSIWFLLKIMPWAENLSISLSFACMHAISQKELKCIPNTISYEGKFHMILLCDFNVYFAYELYACKIHISFTMNSYEFSMHIHTYDQHIPIHRMNWYVFYILNHTYEIFIWFHSVIWHVICIWILRMQNT